MLDIYSKIRARFAKQGGGVFLEVGISAGVFFTLILLLIDFARYQAVQAVLTRGAQEGLSVAAMTADFDIDPRTLPNPSDGRDTKFIDARNRVLQAATRVPLASFLTAGGSDGYVPRLQRMSLKNPFQPMGTPQSAYVSVLRAGDRTIVEDQTELLNPVKPTLSATDSWDTVLTSVPIVVEMRAKFKFLVPFLPQKTVVGRAIGFREVFPKGPYPRMPVPIPTESPTSSPSGTPSPTPTPGEQETPTPSFTASPTTSASPGSTNSPTESPTYSLKPTASPGPSPCTTLSPNQCNEASGCEPDPSNCRCKCDDGGD